MYIIYITIRLEIFESKSWQGLIRNNPFSKASGIWHLFSQMILYLWEMRIFLYSQLDFFFLLYLIILLIKSLYFSTNKISLHFIESLFQLRTQHYHTLPSFFDTYQIRQWSSLSSGPLSQQICKKVLTNLL